MADRLSKEFEQIPDISTISRHVKRFREEFPDELNEDAPFSWSTMSEVQWNDSRLVLGLWADYQTQQMDRLFGPFSRRLAKWSWRVLKAFGLSYTGYRDVGYGSREGKGNQQDANVEFNDPGSIEEGPPDASMIDDVWFVALEYTWREIASIVLHEAFDTRDLDMWLAFTPWRGEDWMDRYQVVKYGPEFKRPGLDTPIHWHLLDIDWLDKVAPLVAKNRSAFLPEKKSVRLRSPIDETLWQAWTQLTDGLLGSQKSHYLAYWKRRAETKRSQSDDTSRPWYFDYLDKVASLGDPNTYSAQNTENAEPVPPTEKKREIGRRLAAETAKKRPVRG
jgi:hypothetical protein